MINNKNKRLIDFISESQKKTKIDKTNDTLSNINSDWTVNDIINKIQKQNIPQKIIDAKKDVVGTQLNKSQVLETFKANLYEAHINLNNWGLFLEKDSINFIACTKIFEKPIHIQIDTVSYQNININQATSIKNVSTQILSIYENGIMIIPELIHPITGLPQVDNVVYIIDFVGDDGTEHDGYFHDRVFVIQRMDIISPNNLEKDKRISINFNSTNMFHLDKNLNAILVKDSDIIFKEQEYNFLDLYLPGHTLLNYGGCFLEFDKIPQTKLTIQNYLETDERKEGLGSVNHSIDQISNHYGSWYPNNNHGSPFPDGNATVLDSMFVFKTHGGVDYTNNLIKGKLQFGDGATSLPENTWRIWVQSSGFATITVNFDGDLTEFLPLNESKVEINLFEFNMWIPLKAVRAAFTGKNGLLHVKWDNVSNNEYYEGFTIWNLQFNNNGIVDIDWDTMEFNVISNDIYIEDIGASDIINLHTTNINSHHDQKISIDSVGSKVNFVDARIKGFITIPTDDDNHKTKILFHFKEISFRWRDGGKGSEATVIFKDYTIFFSISEGQAADYNFFMSNFQNIVFETGDDIETVIYSNIDILIADKEYTSLTPLCVVPMIPIYKNETSQASLNNEILLYSPYFDKTINDWAPLLNIINAKFFGSLTNDLCYLKSFWNDTNLTADSKHNFGYVFQTELFIWAWYITYIYNNNFHYNTLFKKDLPIYVNLDASEDVINVYTFPQVIQRRPMGPAIYLIEALKNVFKQIGKPELVMSAISKEYQRNITNNSEGSLVNPLLENLGKNYTVFNAFNEEIVWDVLPNNGNIKGNGIYSIFQLRMQTMPEQPGYDTYDAHTSPGEVGEDIIWTARGLSNFRNKILVGTSDRFENYHYNTNLDDFWIQSFRPPRAPLGVHFSVSTINDFHAYGAGNKKGSGTFPSQLTNSPMSTFDFGFTAKWVNHIATTHTQYYNMTFNRDLQFFYDVSNWRKKTPSETPTVGLLKFKEFFGKGEALLNGYKIDNISNSRIFQDVIESTTEPKFPIFLNPTQIVPIPNPIQDRKKDLESNKFDTQILNNLMVFGNANINEWPDTPWIDKRLLERYFNYKMVHMKFNISKLNNDEVLEGNILKKITLRGIWGGKLQLKLLDKNSNHDAVLLDLNKYSTQPLTIFDEKDDTSSLTIFNMIYDKKVVAKYN